MPDMTRMSDDHSTAAASQCRPGRCLPTRAPILLLALTTLLSNGCIGRRGNVELLEARLRQHQDMLTRNQRTLAEAQAELNLARQEADLLRRQMADAGASPLPAEFTGTLFRVEDIRFNTLMTGGRDQDNVSGDELLVVVFAPYDEQGDLVKLPGRIELEAIDLNRTEEEGRQIASWTFTPEESRGLWKSAAFSQGFELRLDWPVPPGSEEILLHARLSTADGRHFDASQTIDIAPEENQQTPGTFPAPGVIQPVSRESEILPIEFVGDRRQLTTPPDTGTLRENPFDMADQHKDARPSRPEQEPVLGTNERTVTDSASEPAIAPVGELTDGGGASGDSVDDQEPRPFPPGLRTSDVWTDETIPRLR